MTEKAKLTKEQLDNLMTYGQCSLCGAPRTIRTEVSRKDRKTVYTRVMVCENGHRGY